MSEWPPSHPSDLLLTYRYRRFRPGRWVCVQWALLLAAGVTAWRLTPWVLVHLLVAVAVIWLGKVVYEEDLITHADWELRHPLTHEVVRVVTVEERERRRDAQTSSTDDGGPAGQHVDRQ